MDDADINAEVLSSQTTFGTTATAMTTQMSTIPSAMITSPIKQESTTPPQQPPPSTLPEPDLSGLSARERNRLKRKAKKDAKDKGKEKYVRLL